MTQKAKKWLDGNASYQRKFANLRERGWTLDSRIDGHKSVTLFFRSPYGVKGFVGDTLAQAVTAAYEGALEAEAGALKAERKAYQ